MTQTRAGGVRSVNATSMLCRPPNNWQLFVDNLSRIKRNVAYKSSDCFNVSLMLDYVLGFNSAHAAIIVLSYERDTNELSKDGII